MSENPRVAFFAHWWASWAREIIKKVYEWEIDCCVSSILTQDPESWAVQLANDYCLLVSHLLIKYKNKKYPKQLDEKFYKNFFIENNLDSVFLSGWMSFVKWISAEKLINIHPWETDLYWWEGMYWMNVHNKVWEDYKKWNIKRSCVTMHYATEKYDDGPIIFQSPVELDSCNSAKDVQKIVNKMEHEIQWKITKLLIDWSIKWSGKKEDKLEIINQEEIDKLLLPEWSVFGWRINIIE